MFIFGFLKKVKKNPVPGSDVFSGPRERERRGGGGQNGIFPNLPFFPPFPPQNGIVQNLRSIPFSEMFLEA
jgi:hypothetical protein